MSRMEELYIHCEGFEVELHLSPQKGISPIERLVLEAVHAGMHDFRDINGLFQLSERPTLDLLLELWQRGYVRIDTETGQIELTEEVEDKVQRKDYQGLTGGGLSNHKLELFVERISGHILPTVPWGEGLRKGRVVAPVLPDGAWRKASRAELTAAIRYRFEHTKEHLAHQHLVDFSLPPSEQNGIQPGRNRFLRLEVRCRRGANDLLQIEVLGPSEVPAMLRQSLSVDLTRLASRRRHEPVFKNLLQQLADEEDFTHISVTRALEELGQELGRLEKTTLPEQAFERHQRLELRGQQLVALLAERLAQQGRVRLLESDEQLEWIRSAIQNAQAQVVLAFPQVRYEQLAILLPSLREALGRRTQVALLWGSKRDEQLETTVRSAFEELSLRSPGFQWAMLSSRLNARFVAVDGRQLLISSFPVLSLHAGRRLELGWVFERTAPDDVPPDLANAQLANPCLSSLELARDQLPDYREAQKLRTHPDELRPLSEGRMAGSSDQREAEDAAPPQSPLPKLPALPECLVPPREDLDATGREHWSGEEGVPIAWDPPFQRAELTLWKDAWLRCFHALKQLRTDLGTGASLLQDSDHVMHLWLRLNQAKRFLIIASPRLTRAAVSPRFLRKLKERLHQGLVLVILHDRAVEPGLEAPLQELAVQRPSSFFQVSAPHALNLLVDEQEATLTSFPLLSFDELAMELGRSQSEVGLRVRDPEFSHQMVDWLRAQVPELRSMAGLTGIHRPPTVNLPLKSGEVAPSLPPSPALLELLEHLARGGSTETKRSAIEVWSDAGLPLTQWGHDLEILSSLEIPAEERARIFSAALDRRWEDRAEPAAQRALRWLIGWLWHERTPDPTWRHTQAFPVALLLEELMLEDGLDTLPAQPLLLLLSHYDPARSCDASALEAAWAAADTALRADVRAGEAATVIACAAVLEGKEAGARSWLEQPPAALCPDLVQGVELLRRLDRRAKLQENLEQTVRAGELEESEAAWNATRIELLHALERAKNVKFYYTFGRKVWQHIHKKGGIFHQMWEITSQERVNTLQSLLRDLRQKSVTPSSIIQSTCDELDPYVNSRSGEIDGDKLEPCLNRLSQVFQAAHAWVEADVRRTRARQQQIWNRQAQELLAEVRATVTGVEHLKSEWHRLRHPGHPLLPSLLDLLQRLTRSEGDRS